MMDQWASDTEIAEMVGAVQDNPTTDSETIEALIGRYPGDPRLHFMLGSVFAAKGRAIEAHRAMSRALELAPDYALARYQLGFFEMTSGEPTRALSTWGPLLAQPRDNYLRIFVEGMTHLIRDEFADAIARLEEGVRCNHDNLPMNDDVRLLIAECRKLLARNQNNADDELSATSLLLNRFGGHGTLQ